MRLQWFIVPPCGASPAQNERQAALCEPPAAKLQLDCKLLYTPGGGLSIPGRACAPLSVSPPCGRLASSPEGGAKRTAVKPGKRRVRRSCEQVCLTTTGPAPTGVRLAPPVGELSAKLTERATGRRSVIRSISAPRNVPNEITIYTYTTKTTKRLFSGRFVLFVGFVAFVIPLGGRGIVISLKPLVSCFSGGTVKS